MEKELTELNLGGKVIPILEKDKGTKGTSEDYAKLEAKILLRTEQNREMMEQSMINAEHSLSVGEKYSNLTKACHNYPEIQLRTKEKAIKLSKTKFSEQDFITLLLSKLLDNGISKIDTMKLKHILADYYSEEYYACLFNEDDRKNNESCKLEQHKALLYIDDVSEKYSNDMENNVYYECICLECGKHKDYKMSLNDRRHIIKTNLSPMETFMSFYEVRKRYLELIKQNCTVEEIIDNLNSFYKKNQKQPVLTKKKN